MLEDVVEPGVVVFPTRVGMDRGWKDRTRRRCRVPHARGDGPPSSAAFHSQIRLDALPSESAEEILDDLLGSAPGLEILKPLLIRRGNPFFLEETVRTLVETGALAGERGRYRLVKPVQAVQVPPTVQTILAARIDRLPPEEKRLLQTASVIGKDVPFSLLQAIADLPDDALRRGLTNLQAAEFLYETQLFPDLEHSFSLRDAYTLAGRLNDARRAAERASADARELRAPGLKAWARCLLVIIEAESDRPNVEIAERHAAGAISVATELGLRPLAARCHAELAKLYRRTGKQPEADEHFQTATSMYLEMGMQFWLERAEAEMAKLGRSAP